MALGLVLLGVVLLAGGLVFLGLWGYPKLTYKIEFHQNWSKRAMSECGCRLPGQISHSRGLIYRHKPKSHSTLICYDCGRYWMYRVGGYHSYWDRAPKWKVFQMRRGWDRDDLRMKTVPVEIEVPSRQASVAQAKTRLDRLLRRSLNERIGSSRRI